MSNEQRTRCPVRTRSGTRQPRGHQDHLNTTGNVTAEAILHPQLPEFGAMAPGVHASRGQSFKIKHAGRCIRNEWRSFRYLHDDDDHNNNNNTQNTELLLDTEEDLRTFKLYQCKNKHKTTVGREE